VVSKEAVRGFLAGLAAAGDTTLVLTTHDLADIERLCRRLVVIDRGRIVHDGSLAELHARYGSRRRVGVHLDEPLAAPPAAPGAAVESVDADGRRITFLLDGDSAAAAALVRRLAEIPALRDVAILEPRIEDVVARLYAERAAGGPGAGP
jgi:ABC-2 type transport system ATP-binding protein